MLSWIYDVWTSFVGRITTQATLHKTIEEETGEIYVRRDDGPNKEPTVGINWKTTEQMKQLPEALDTSAQELEASITTAMSLTDNTTSSRSISVRSPIEIART